MTSLPIYDRAGNQIRIVRNRSGCRGARCNKQLLHDVVVMYQASRRQGTQKTKSRGEVRGSTKKLYRQKGTGNARAGSRRSGVRRGGGHIHALQPRDYSYRLAAQGRAGGDADGDPFQARQRKPGLCRPVGFFGAADQGNGGGPGGSQVVRHRPRWWRQPAMT